MSANPSLNRNAGNALLSTSSPANFLDGIEKWHHHSAESSANAMTCDVEDYFQVSAFEHLVPKSSWSTYECRIARNIDKTLQLYDEAGVKGTFFILGWVAENHPSIVRQIADLGHEIASHGMQHVRVSSMSEKEFLKEARLSRSVLEDVSGQQVKGFRAASWSFDQRTPWAHHVLAESGYLYSSSVYPVAHDHYGVPNAPISPFYVAEGEVLEIPATAARILRRNVPAAGGGFFRLFPYKVSNWLFTKAQSISGVPGVFYFHPWELDPTQPRMQGINSKVRFRHYINLHRFESRLKAMLRDFSWGRMDSIYLGESE